MRYSEIQMLQKLSEARIEKAIWRDSSTTVWVDPSRSEIQTLLNKFKHNAVYVLRGIVGMDGTIYVWDSKTLIHHLVGDSLGINIKYFLYFRLNGTIICDSKDPNDGDMVRYDPKTIPELAHIMPRETTVSESIEILPISYGANGQTKDIKVWKNERNIDSIMKKLGNMARGIVDHKGNYYIWDEYEATHFDIKKVLEKGGAITDDELWDEGVNIKLYRRDDGDYYVSVHNVFGQKKLDSPEVPEFIRNALSKVKKKISEGKVEIVNANNREVKVWKNPSKKDFVSLFMNGMGGKEDKFRGIIDVKGDLYIWRADQAIHQQIEYASHITSGFELYFGWDIAQKIYYSSDKKWRGVDGYSFEDVEARHIPSFQRAMGLNNLSESKVKDVLNHLLSNIRPPTDDVYEVMDANFNSSKLIGNQLAPIESLHGGVSNSPREEERVKTLMRLMSGPSGYFSRLIVDQDGNVIEGQHRLEAARKLGLKRVPIVRVQDLESNFPTEAVKKAIENAKPTHSDHINQLVTQLADIFFKEGSADVIAQEYEPPKGFEVQWNAGIAALKRATLSEGIYEGVETVFANKQTVKVWSNPSHAQLLNILKNLKSFNPFLKNKVKGIIDNKGTLFIWDAHVAIHDQIASSLGVKVKFELFIGCRDDGTIYYSADYRDNSDPDYALEDVRNIPSFNRAMNFPNDLTEGITSPMLNIPKYLYKWVSGKQFQKYIDVKKLPVKRKYAHYINDSFISGNSFTDKDHIHKWKAYNDTLIRIDTTGLSNDIYPIPGNKTYLRTKGLTTNLYDPNCWKLESDEIDEYWIAGPLDLSSVMVVNVNDLTEGRLEDFKQLADDQRHRPELAMLDAQNALREYPGGPALGNTLEHVGDLTHRMSQKFCERMGYGEEWVAPKVRRSLWFVNNRLDIAAAKALPELPELKAYADAHAKLKVYNTAQKAARNAAVALGNRNFEAAKKNLNYLQGLIDSGKFQEEASKYNLLMETVTPNIKGFWITDKGEFISCDYENDIHHGDLLSSHFSIPKHRDRNNEIDWSVYHANVHTALENGWVRCSSTRDQLNVQWGSLLSKETKRALLKWISEYGKMFENLRIDNPFTTGAFYFDVPTQFYSEIKKRISEEGK